VQQGAVDSLRLVGAGVADGVDGGPGDESAQRSDGAAGAFPEVVAELEEALFLEVPQQGEVPLEAYEDALPGLLVGRVAHVQRVELEDGEAGGELLPARAAEQRAGREVDARVEEGRRDIVVHALEDVDAL